MSTLDVERLPFYWDCKKGEWALESGEKFDGNHAVTIGGFIEGVSYKDRPSLALINLRVKVEEEFKFFCVYVEKDEIDPTQVKEGYGCVCEIFPAVSTFFFAKYMLIVPRHTLLAIRAGINEALEELDHAM